jgi:transcriptional regulator with XRE-family HTH domain
MFLHMSEERDAEITRVTELLKTVVRVAGLSHREIEKRLGQSPGYLSRLFAGAIELKLKHIIDILAVIKVEPHEFFQLAYPRQTGVMSATARQARDLLTLFPPGGEPERGRVKQEEVDEMVRSAIRRLLGELGIGAG